MFFLLFLLVTEGSGSVALTNGSGSGRPKNIRILRIRIRNTGGNYFKFLTPMYRFLWRSCWLRSWATLCLAPHIPDSGRITSSSSTRGRHHGENCKEGDQSEGRHKITERKIAGVRVVSQSRQSAKLFLQSSSALGLPHPLSRRRVCSPTLWSGGEGTLAGGRGVGGVPISTRGHTVHCGALYL